MIAANYPLKKLRMALYRSAELGEVVKMPCPELENSIPPVARTRTG